MTKNIMGNIKTLKDISWQVTEEEYRADPAYSYSTIAKFTREGFEKLDKLFDKVESPSLLFGSMVDTLLTDGQEAFDERFFVADFPEIPDTIKKIVDSMYDNLADEYMSIADIPDKVLLPYIDMHDYQRNWKAETRCKVVKEKAGEYYNLKHLSEGKQVVSSKLYEDTLACIEALKTSEATRWYFAEDNPFDGIQRYYQLKFKGEYEGIQLRCMADLIICDTVNKVIIPCDLKTSYKIEDNFYKSFIEWSYFEQASLYAEIIKQNIAKYEEFKDYKVLDYRFIVISNGTKKPLVWEWPLTHALGDIKFENLVLPDWRNKVKELHYYLTISNNHKIGINTTTTNNIKTWIEKDYGRKL